MASPSNTLNDQANGTRLCRLLVDKGTQALREKFNSVFPPSNLAADSLSVPSVQFSYTQRKTAST